MDFSRSSDPSSPGPGREHGITDGAGRSRHRRRKRHRSGSRVPRSYAWADRASGWLLLFLTVFTPWAFGTTQGWAVGTATAASCCVGVLLLAKHLLRRNLDYRPPVWGEHVVVSESSGQLQQGAGQPDLAGRILAALTVLFLGYVAVSAWNARADYNEVTRQFEYFEAPWRWLPHSYDRGATWYAFWQYAGLACVFWGLRDWLRHRSPADEREDDTPRWADPQAPLVIPSRLRLLLWILCANGAVLALVSILQRADGTNRLLWLLESRSSKPANFVFGPWAYRGNAAQYFNLLWPVCLAFWLWMQERATRALTGRLGRFDGPQLVLLPCAAFMAACPMISGSRGGALVSVALGATAALLILLVSRREMGSMVRWLTAGGMALAGLVAAIGGWSMIRERLSTPDPRFPTQVEVGTDDFTFLVRVTLPEVSPDKWEGLVILGGDARGVSTTHSLILGLVPRGGLIAQFNGTSLTNFSRITVTNLLEGRAGREVTLAFVRQNGFRAFADGTPLASLDHHNGRAPGWSNVFLTRYAWSKSPRLTGIGLVNFAMTPEELAAASKAGLDSLRDGLPSETTPIPLAGLQPDAIRTLTGVQLETTTRRSQPDVPWIALRRTADPGPLGLLRTLEGLDPRLRGPLRVRATVWNPTDEFLHLGASLDQGVRAVAELPPRSERTVALVARPNHGSTPRSLELVLADEDGGLLETLPRDAQILIRDLQLQPGGAVFAQPIQHEFRLLDLSDRMSGRSELYESARPMLEDFPWWGSGAGTFATMHQLYLKPGQDWAAYLHNDWIEFRITLGRVGLGLLVALLAVLLVRSWIGRGLSTMRVIIGLWWLALGGCLAHARFDFPFQVYSVAFLFLVLASVLSVITAARWR